MKIKLKDKQVEKLILNEEKRQKDFVALIPSENFVSKDVENAVGTVFGNKYCEGYPGKRYYGGQEFTDKLEILTQERALKVFKLSKKNWDVNVQALSGSPMNLAVYFGLLNQGDTIMGMKLTAGGHLTHGHSVSITGKYFKSVQFGVDENGLLDFAEIEKLAVENKPKIIVAGFTAYSKVIDWKKFREICDKVGALLMVDMSHIAGLIAGGAYPSPFPYADIVTTTTHKTLRGPRGGLIFTKIQPGDVENKEAAYKKINKAVFPGLQGGPHMNTIAGICVALGEALNPKFKRYAKQIVLNARAFAKEFQKLGYKVVSGGTDSHMFLLDVWADGVGLTGAQASEALEKNKIIVNKNTIPGERRTPFDPSGIRVGTPAETTRGWKEKQFVKLAQKMDAILKNEIIKLNKNKKP
jgi:glycine hydroxymethyltransferase